MAVQTIGRIENKVGFSIDRPSWKNLDKYQKRIGQLKKQLQGLGNTKVGVIGGRVGAGSRSSGGGGGGRRSKSSGQDAHIKARERHIRNITRRQDMMEARKIRTSGEGGFFDRSRLKPEQMEKFNRQIAEINQKFMSGAITTREYSARISNVQANMSKANREMKSFNKRFREWRTMLVAGGIGYAGFEAGSEVVRTGQQFEATEAKMLIGTGSPEKAAEAIKFVRGEVTRLGLDLITAQDGFARLSIASKEALDEGQVKELYTAFSELGVAAKIDPERMKLGMRAIEQMLNKGTLMAEEVKNQFSESIPNGLGIFSRAMGVSNKEFLKMMERGELLAKDVLPKVAKEMSKMSREGGALDKSLKSNQTAMNRMKAAFQDLKNQFFRGGFGDLTTKLFESLANTMKILTPIAYVFGRTLNTAFTLLTLPIRLIVGLLTDLMNLLGIDGQSVVSKFTGTILGVAAAWALWVWRLKAIAKYILPVLSGLGSMATAGGTLALWLGRIGTLMAGVIGGIVGFPALVVTAVITALSAIYYFWDDIKKFATETYDYIASLFSGDSFNISASGPASGGDVGAAVVRSAAQSVSVNNSVAVEVDLKSDMLDARISQGASSNLNSLQSALASNSSQ